MKRVESLQFDRFVIYQDDELGCFTRDPVELVHFMRIKRNDRCLDIGTGNGIIAIYAQARQGGEFTGIDVDEAQLALARESAEVNKQDISFLNMNFINAPCLLGYGGFDVVVSNPPYFTEACEKNAHRQLQRHGDEELWDELFKASFLLLKNGGRFYMCCPSELLAKAFSLLCKNRLEPKRMELLANNSSARLALIETVKLGKISMYINVREG
ncbi:MAG TPA: methyltransferase [Eubacteriales bacterium]|nr:methyltransferase [Eubacteriales bacterium]